MCLPSHVLASRADLILLTREVTEQGPRDQRGHHLRDGPVDAEDGEEILMARRKKLQEDGAVHGQVAADAKAPKGREDPNGGEVGRASRDHPPDGSGPEGGIEADLAPEDVASEAPKYGSGEEADVLREAEEGRPRGVELVRDWRQDERCHDGPKVVRGPAETHDDEELPLIPSHADVLDLLRMGMVSLATAGLVWNTESQLAALFRTLAFAS